MDLMKPFGTIATMTRQTVRHPVDTGVKVVGTSIGLVRGAAGVVTARVAGKRESDVPRSAPEPADTPQWPATEPITKTPGDLPTPADLAERVSPTDDVTTPVGTTGAGAAYNPDTAETELQQPGTEPLMDPSTTKAVASETETLRRGADLDKG
jgi:hypothetical protein